MKHKFASRHPRPESRVWLNLAPAWLASLLVGVIISYGRARYPNLIDPRYQTMMMPVGLVTYLLLVQRGVLVVPQFLALIVAVCVGWNWPDALVCHQSMYARMNQFARELRGAEQPLSNLAVLRADHVGLPHAQEYLLGRMLELRNARLSIFRKSMAEDLDPSKIWAWRGEAGTGKLRGTMEEVNDERALAGRAIQTVPGRAQSGQISFEIDVPASGTYLLWGRMVVLPGTPPLSLQVDTKPAIAWPISAEMDYHTCVLGTPLELTAGKHVVTLSQESGCIRLDHLDLITFVR